MHQTSTRVRRLASCASTRDDDDALSTARQRASTRLHRFYVDEPLGPGALVRLSKEETRHATKALRLKPGNALEVCDGVGGVGRGTILDIGAHGEAAVEIDDFDFDSSSSGLDWDCIVAFGGLKGGRGDTLVEKAAELGARRLTPFVTTRSAVIGGGDRDGGSKSRARKTKNDDSDSEGQDSSRSGRESRWGRVAQAASKQSLRARALEVTAPASIDAVCRAIQSAPLALIAAAGAPPIIDVLRDASDVSSGIIIVGPEGDFTDEELRALTDAGAKPVGLGGLRLRVETAAISALAAVSAVVEERGK